MANPRSGMQALHDVVRALERKRKSRIWCILHCNMGHICGPTMRPILEGRESVGTGEKIEILVHSGGGHPDIAYRLIKFFRGRFKQVNIIVPGWAKSAATIMCLGADRIYLGELADLGPIDIQLDDPVRHGDKPFSPLDEFKSLEFLREQAAEWMDYYATVMNAAYGMSIKDALRDSVPLVSALMRPILEKIDPVEMGGYRRAIAIGEEYAKRMLRLTKNPNAHRIIEKTVWGYPSHDFCIDFDEAFELGLPVERLDPAQDRMLFAAILNVEKDHYHGFVPPAQAATRARPARKKRAGAVAGGSKARRANRSDGARQKERVPTPGSPLKIA